jgi:hypothetical protein
VYGLSSEKINKLEEINTKEIINFFIVSSLIG